MREWMPHTEQGANQIYGLKYGGELEFVLQNLFDGIACFISDLLQLWLGLLPTLLGSRHNLTLHRVYSLRPQLRVLNKPLNGIVGKGFNDRDHCASVS